jgi:hypothetical protein
MSNDKICATFGHSWAIRIIGGRPVEICTVCKTRATS